MRIIPDKYFYKFYNLIPVHSKKILYFMAFYHKTPIRFKCTQCSQCCYGGKHAYVRANAQEIENIIAFMNIDLGTFKNDYLVKLVDHGYGIRMKQSLLTKAAGKEGHCALLDEIGKCSVYPVRPTQCRTYPFWPEILISEQKWNDEINRCEGINLGDVVDIEHIEEQKELSVAAEIIINN